MKPTLFIASPLGQLGNRLVLFAHLIAVAKEYGLNLVNPSFSQYAHDFEGPSASSCCAFPVRGAGKHSPLLCNVLILGFKVARKLRIERMLWATISNSGMDPKDNYNLAEEKYLKIIKSGRRTVLWGWRYRNYQLVPKHAEAIRQYFRPILKRRMTAEALVKKIREETGYVLGIHIRQGDYRDYQDGKHFFETADYVACMRQMLDELKRQDIVPSFLVCSNVPQSAEDFQGIDVVFGTGQIVEDLHALSLCAQIVAVPSTYSYWASFMGKVPLRYVTRDEKGRVMLEAAAPFPEAC